MRDYDDVPYIVIERRSGGAGPFLWGALLGAGAALLLAPRSGEQTQEEIRERMRRIRSAAEDRVTDARSTVTEAITRTRDEIQERIDHVRDTIDTRTTRARDAVDAGRRAARDARSELQRRVAEAKESYSPVTGGMNGSEGELDSPPSDVFMDEGLDRPELG